MITDAIERADELRHRLLEQGVLTPLARRLLGMIENTHGNVLSPHAVLDRIELELEASE